MIIPYRFAPFILVINHYSYVIRPYEKTGRLLVHTDFMLADITALKFKAYRCMTEVYAQHSQEGMHKINAWDCFFCFGQYLLISNQRQ